MAFFLVMWLINATDEKTKADVSTYFNPIKLPDQSESEKALQSTDSSPGKNEEATNARTAPKGKEFKGSGEEQGKGIPKKTDEALFADPYGILSKLATQAVRLQMPKQAGMRKDGVTEFSIGSAFRDPFDLDFRKRHRDDIKS
jgi:chemotaxis protein MotB